MTEAMKALRPFTYNRVRLKEGDLFKCLNKDVKLVVAARLATKPDVKIATPTYQTRHLEAAKPEMTVPELREAIQAKGVFLPSGYIPKSELRDILAREGST